LAAVCFEPVGNWSSQRGKGTKAAATVFTTPDNPTCLPGGVARDQQKWIPVLPGKRLRLSRDRALIIE
jgi:hypothetical protein